MNTAKMKLLPIFLLLPFFAFSQSDKYFKSGQELQLAENWNEAIVHYQIALEQNPNHEDALFNHAICAKQLNKMTVVKKDINNILSINPNNINAIEWRGAIALDEERWGDAINDFTTVLKEEEIFEVRLNRAIAYLENNQPELCYGDLVSCRNQQEHHAGVHAIFGDYHLKKENLPEAMSAYQKSLKTFSENPIVLNNCGIIATKEDNFKEAIDYFTRASELEPRSDIFAHLALAYIENNDLINATQYGTLAITKDLNESRGHFALGMVKFKKRIFDEAIEYFDDAVNADVDFKDAYLMRAKSNIELSLTRVAKPDLLKVISLDPENAEAQRLLKNL